MLAKEGYDHAHGFLVIPGNCWILQIPAIHPTMLHVGECLEDALRSKLVLPLQGLLCDAALLCLGLVVLRRQEHLRAANRRAHRGKVLPEPVGQLSLGRVAPNRAADVRAGRRVEGEPAAPAEAQDADLLGAPLLHRRDDLVVQLRTGHRPGQRLHRAEESRRVEEAGRPIREPPAPRPSWVFVDYAAHGVGDFLAAAAPAFEKQRQDDQDA
mmetsp:Transcript_54531/g.165761  ORF Transcript_54531/g.165761 Transcript_54531/m.165761 type:complete len:212 (-) Transcript_54531:265-900(-)